MTKHIPGGEFPEWPADPERCRQMFSGVVSQQHTLLPRATQGQGESDPAQPSIIPKYTPGSAANTVHLAHKVPFQCLMWQLSVQGGVDFIQQRDWLHKEVHMPRLNTDVG